MRECFGLLFKNRPLLMLFLGNIFFVVCKIAEQVSFYFVADLMFDRRYNVVVDVIKFPGFLLAGLIVPKLIEMAGRKADSKRFYQLCCVSAICDPYPVCSGMLPRPDAQGARLAGLPPDWRLCHSIYRPYHHPSGI